MIIHCIKIHKAVTIISIAVKNIVIEQLLDQLH